MSSTDGPSLVGIARSYDAARPAGSHRAIAWLPALLLLLGATPLLVARPAALQDWANHLARVRILDALLRGDAFWDRFYEFTGFLVPNAALDLGVLGLARAGLGQPAAAQMFLLVTYALFVGGFLALARALRANGPEKSAFAVLLFYSAVLFWGLVNYVLGLGLMLALVAAWLGTRSIAVRLAVATLGAAILLFVHAVPAVAFAVLLGCLDLPLLARGAWRRLPGLSSVLALAAVAILLPGDAGRDGAVIYADAGTVFGFVVWKLNIFATTLLGGSVAQDGATLLAICLALVAMAFAASPRIGAGALLGAVVMAGLVVALPERVGTGSLLDMRIALVPLLVLAAGVRPAWHGARARNLAIAGLFAAVAARTVVIAAEWRASDRVFADYRARVASLPAGSIMLMGYGTKLDRLSWPRIWSPPVTSIAAQVVSGGVFFPHVFANPAQQPISLRPQYAGITQPWDLSDAEHWGASRAGLRAICDGRAYAGVFLTVLYPGDAATERAGVAVLVARPDFLILDACRLPP